MHSLDPPSSFFVLFLWLGEEIMTGNLTGGKDKTSPRGRRENFKISRDAEKNGNEW